MTQKSSSIDRRHDSQTSSNDIWKFRLDVAMQFSLFWLLAALIWQLLGHESRDAWEHCLRLSFIGLGCSLAAGLRIANSQLPKLVKTTGIFVCVLIMLFVGIRSAQEFEASTRVLRPAHLEQKRIVHEGIPLSYAVLPDFQVKFQPAMMRTLVRQTSKNSQLPLRLLFGEVALLSQIVKSTVVRESGHTPTSITLQVGHELDLGLNAFVLKVQLIEEILTASPDVRIVLGTHHSRFAGIDMFEFEFVNERKRLMSRYVFLQTGTFVVNFVFNTEDQADRPLFDEFLNSIRLDSAI